MLANYAQVVPDVSDLLQQCIEKIVVFDAFRWLSKLHWLNAPANPSRLTMDVLCGLLTTKVDCSVDQAAANSHEQQPSVAMQESSGVGRHKPEEL